MSHRCVLVLALLSACTKGDSDETDLPADTEVQDTDLPPDTDLPADTDHTDLPPDTDREDTDRPPDTGDDTDRPNPPPFHPRDDITVDWNRVDSGGRVRIDIYNSGATGFYMGMADTASGGAGWYGEDCLNFDCHHWSNIHARLDYVESIGDIVMSRTTIFDGGSDGAGDAFTSAGADRLTYLIQLEGGPFDAYCYVWGDDPSYYAGEGCQVL